MHAQIDAADANKEDEDGKPRDADPLHHAVLLVLPHHPQKQSVERHRNHGMARGEAVAHLRDQTDALVRTLPLDNLFQHEVDAHRKHQVDGRADAGPAPWRKCLHNQQHAREHHR